MFLFSSQSLNLFKKGIDFRRWRSKNWKCNKRSSKVCRTREWYKHAWMHQADRPARLRHSGGHDAM